VYLSGERKRLYTRISNEMKKLIFSFIVLGGLFLISSHVFAQNAVLYFVPAEGDYSPGQTIRTTVMVDTQGADVNAVAAYVTYPSDALDVLLIDTAGSALSLVTKPLLADPLPTNGKIEISGTVSAPGVSGIQKIASVDFKVKAGISGTALLSFAVDAAVLDDTNNQNILSLPDSGSASFQIVPEEVPTPTLIPDQEQPADNTLKILDAEAQQTTPDSIRISWRTDKPATAQVNYGLNGEYAFSVFDGELKNEHSILITDLQSNLYEFDIKSETAAGEIALLEDVSLEDLIPEGQEIIIAVPKNPNEFMLGGFHMDYISLTLFVILPIMVFLLIVLLFVRKTRKGRMG
jgi:hypothetical protein